MTTKGFQVAPRVSVIIPVFNDAAGLIQCLDGLERQSYPADRIEVVVIDNGSNPPIKVPSKDHFPLRLLHCAKPGSYAARNLGAESARGEILAFTDADCTPDPNWLSAGVARLIREGQRCFVGGEVEVLPPSPRTGTGLYQYLTGFEQRKNILERRFSATANLLCWTHQFTVSGLFAEDLLSGGDLEWCVRAAEQGFTLVFEPLAIVATPPRTSLAAAIRQARRVVGGRRQLASKHSKVDPACLARHRSPLEALRWIFSNPNLRQRERLRVLGAALAIRAAAALEGVRLQYGGAAERR